jgi:class 3 adenylate cyclase
MISTSLKSANIINPLLPGKKIFGVFCFISIHHFDKLSLDLREDVLLYANTVARMVHCVSETYQGQINKNLGDMFLLVWKFTEDDVIVTPYLESLNPFSSTVRQKSTLALVSAVKIQAKLAKSPSMKRFSARTIIRLDVSIGLHAGWAFEGPIGSTLKIDATYISPHINLTSRVESAAKIYQVYITASEEFAYRLDESVRQLLRHIDTIILKGTTSPLKLFCFDLSLNNLEESKSVITKKKVETNKTKIKEALDYNYFTAADLITQSGRIAEMRTEYTPQFFEAYDQALQLYLGGEWRKARRIFKETCLKLVPMDGPTTEVLNFMAAAGYAAPEGWPGFRVHGSK